MRANELRDLVVSALLLAVAFGIAFSGGLEAFSEPRGLVEAILIALIGVSLGFVLHEIAHRLVARRYGFFAEYVMWPAGLLIALAGSLFGFIFAAPGAVMIHPRMDAGGVAFPTKEKSGIISVAGPVMNIGLAIVFLILDQIRPALIFSLGSLVNAWLATFNLIPLGPLDGTKILAWSKGVWALLLVLAIALLVTRWI